MIFLKNNIIFLFLVSSTSVLCPVSRLWQVPVAYNSSIG
nr:MAG TPA: hypothetical protein [Caudoviricetes sp.]